MYIEVHACDLPTALGAVVRSDCSVLGGVLRFVEILLW